MHNPHHQHTVIKCLPAVVLWSFASLAGAVTTNTWTGNVSTDWHDAGNWSLPDIPRAGTNVVIDGSAAREVVLGASTEALGDVTMADRTLIFSNATTVLYAQDLTLLANANLTHIGPYATNDTHHAVTIECSDFWMHTNATINVAGQGYRKGQGPGSAGDNLGSGSPGAGHGGRGGQGAARQRTHNQAYGDAVSPVTPGSGGTSFSTSWAGGPGGGVVRITASGKITVHGTIDASGNNSPDAHSAGGAGGSIWIDCDEWDGNGGGTVQANGGAGGGTSNAGGGGGGRIAVHYTTWTGNTATRFHAWPGNGFYRFVTLGSGRGAWPGTLYFSDDAWLGQTVSTVAGRLHIGSTAALSRADLHISDGLIGVSSNLSLTTSGTLRISGAGHLMQDGGSVIAGGDIILTNSACYYLVSGPTNGAATDYGALLQAGGKYIMTTGSRTFFASHLIDGGAPRLRADSLLIEGGAIVDAIAKGFDSNLGPGAGSDGSEGAGGGGHGGRGGDGRDYRYGGKVYGDSRYPALPGSGGGKYNISWRGGRGGGLIWLQITNQATMAGSILADAENGDGYSAGGAGGAIRIDAGTITANAGGLLRANGGNSGGGNAGGGAGGRIALHADTFNGPLTLRLQVIPGNGHAFTYRNTGHPRGARYGTIYLSDADPLRTATTVTGVSGILILDSLADWEVSALTLDQSTLGFPTGLTVRVANDLVLTGAGAGLLLHEGELAVDGDITLKTGARMYLHAAATNGLSTRYGLRLACAGHFAVSNNAWVFPYSHPTDGGSVFMSAAELTVADGGGFNADTKGFASTRGPGAGASNQGAGGGGYGGRGGDGRYQAGGSEVGDDLDMALLLPGSGGGSHGDAFRVGGYGGGLIELAVAGNAVIDGTFSANGETGRGWAGGGSGGAVWLRTGSLAGGVSAILRANGGAGGSPEGGGGGGGRIVVWVNIPETIVPRFIENPTGPVVRLYPYSSFNGAVTTTAGSGYTATQEDGSRFFAIIRGSMVLFR